MNACQWGGGVGLPWRVNVYHWGGGGVQKLSCFEFENYARQSRVHCSITLDYGTFSKCQVLTVVSDFSSRKNNVKDTSLDSSSPIIPIKVKI